MPSAEHWVFSLAERVVVDETRSAFTSLSLFGLCVDCVVLNRVLPAEACTGYFKAWGTVQAREVARTRDLFGSAPVLELHLQPDETLGVAALKQAGRELYRGRDPAASFVDRPPVTLEERSGATALLLRLPNADGRTLELKQRGGELIVSAQGWRSQLPLPRSLEGRAIRSARFADGVLELLFEPRHSPRKETP